MADLPGSLYLEDKPHMLHKSYRNDVLNVQVSRLYMSRDGI